MRTPYPGEASLAPLRDKRCLPALAARVGLRTPSTLAAGRADEVLRGRLPERCVIKPTAIAGELGGVRVADSVEELRTLLAALPPAEEVLLQERLSGTLAALSVVIDRGGSVVRRFQQRTLRTWPPEIGVSSLAVGVVSDEELTDRVRALLAETGFWGMAQLQFLEQRDGPRLIDVNPRIYGSLALALALGGQPPGGLACRGARSLDRSGRPVPRGRDLSVARGRRHVRASRRSRPPPGSSPAAGHRPGLGEGRPAGQRRPRR